MENWISDEYNIDRKWAGDEVEMINEMEMTWRWTGNEPVMNWT